MVHHSDPPPPGLLASILRTVVPVAVGVLLVQALRLGVELPEGAVTEIVTVAVTAAYYGIARALETYVSPVWGRILLSLGLTRRRPEYDLAA
ncbi:hypothetical protein [Allonocardiopsis opalescens]|uniref:Uncharacterized protein n=1 Tax=Allonocardiopsis opalescens TaxID=1144618 RepID=A0A2T0PPJ1_9ACTN|nr:hypothetical protein [Allonocardiopsis opalescens]PRX90813.1 hypothetical protein CLV72_1169 [Allonocardiopsis opalescens]